ATARLVHQRRLRRVLRRPRSGRRRLHERGRRPRGDRRRGQRCRGARARRRPSASQAAVGVRAQLRARDRGRGRAAPRVVLLPGERLMDFPILTALVLLPAISAVIVALLPSRRPEVIKVFALVAATLTGALSIALLVAFDRKSGGFQFV